MKKIVSIFVSVVLGSVSFGWGSGHDVIGRLVFEKLPQEISNNFSKSQINLSVKKWSHYPDCTEKFSQNPLSAESLGVRDAAVLESVFKIRYRLHSLRGKCAAFALLTRAFKEKNFSAAALYIGALSHSVADVSAFNHAPMIHMKTYFDYAGDKPENEIYDLIVVDEIPVLKNMVSESLRDFVPAPSADSLVSAFKKIAEFERLDPAFLASVEGNIVSPKPDGKNFSRKYLAAMAAIADRQTRACVGLICAAWKISQTAQTEKIAELDILDASKKDSDIPVLRSAETSAKEFLANAKISDCAVFDGIDVDCGEKADIGFVVEPYAKMEEAKLGFGSRPISARMARTAEKSGLKTVLLPYSKIVKSYPNARRIAVVAIISDRELPNPTGLEKYIADGGKLLIVGGKGIPNTHFAKYFATKPDSEIPVIAKWGAVNGENVEHLSVELAGAFAEAPVQIFSPDVQQSKSVFLFRRNPNRTGWAKPISDVAIATEKNALPLAYIRDDRTNSRYACAALLCEKSGKPAALYLPQYLIMPALFGIDAPIDLSRPELDSFGAPLLLKSIQILMDK